MCALAATQIAKPRDEQDFEDACVELWRDLLGDPNVQANGRRGQRQDGVDLFGSRNRDPRQQVGVQCKLKGPNSHLTEKEVRKEVALARTFRPRLSEYVIATTAPDDQALQRVARELTLEFHDTDHPMTVAVWGWGTMERRIAESPHGRRAFEPGRFPHGEQILASAESARAENRENFAALFNQLAVIEARVSMPAPQDADATTSLRLAVEAALDAQIDDLRDMGNAGQLRVAFDQLTRLLERVRGSASGRILFRITANIAASAAWGWGRTRRRRASSSRPTITRPRSRRPSPTACWPTSSGVIGRAPWPLAARRSPPTPATRTSQVTSCRRQAATPTSRIRSTSCPRRSGRPRA
jgi:hypothetical protein